MIDQGVDGNPRIKMYANDEGDFNGEALVVYFKKESVDLAITLMDDYEFRLGDYSHGKIKVNEADHSFRKNKDTAKIVTKMGRKERKAAERTRADMQR
jgi:HIV Tat-specific factor 1